MVLNENKKLAEYFQEKSGMWLTVSKLLNWLKMVNILLLVYYTVSNFKRVVNKHPFLIEKSLPFLSELEFMEI